MARLRLQVLGAFRLFGLDGQPRQLPTRKAEALLAYLAMPPGRPHRRDRLAALLWGDRGDKQARHSLNQTIFSIRKALAEPSKDPILARGETLALNAEAIEVDADQLKRLADSQDPADWTEVATIYRGDLLEGLNLREEIFEDWLLSERTRLREVAVATLNKLLETQIARDQNDAAIQTALGLLALDSMQEPVHRDLMQLYAEQGRHGAALRQYEACRATLHRDLGVTPNPETEALFRTISEQRARNRPPVAESRADGEAPVRARIPEPQSVTSAPSGARDLSQPERKHLTVLCAEIEPQYGTNDDPELALEYLDPVMNSMTGVVGQFHGTVANRQSHAITVLFGAPAAHEDHAVRACYAALAIQEVVNQDFAGRLRLRIGLHSGEVVVRPHRNGETTRYEAVGQAVELASQIQQSLPPGAIGLSAEALREVEGYVETEPAGSISQSESGPPTEVFVLTHRTQVTRSWQVRAARGLTEFVGRNAEMAVLERALERASSGDGQVVAIVGAPGIGKSRLVHEFADSHSTTEWSVLEAGASPLETATAFGVISQLLRSWFKIEDKDSQPEVAAKIRKTVLALDEALARSLPVLFSLFDLPIEDDEWPTLSPAQRRRHTLGCLKAVLSRLSQERPLLVILEDLHWIDGETQNVLDTLIDGLGAFRLMLLVTYRPEYRHDWTGRSGFSVVRLDPLPVDSAEMLLHNLLGDHPSLSQVRQMLIERTEGVPLFLEETVRTLVETDTFVGTAGHYRLNAAMNRVEIPTSVQAVIAARIDRLPPKSKSLLQAAAIIGVEVPDGLLRPISHLPEEDYYEALSTLQSAEFLYEIRQLPDVEYGFKHALTHDVAYNGLLRERRRALHVELVRIIEERHHGRLDEQAERLAYHAVSGGLTDEAVDYLYRAALKAIRRSAHSQAIEHIGKGLSLLKSLPETSEHLQRELDYQKAMGVAMMAAKGWGAQEVSDAYTRAREICEKLGDKRELFTALRGQGQFHMIRGELHTARELGEHCVTLSERMQDPGLDIETHHLLWSNSFFLGDYGSASDHANEGIARYERESHHHLTYVYSGHDPGVCCRAFSGLILWQQGYPERAVARCRESLALAEKLSHPLTLALAYWGQSYLYLFRQEPQVAAEWATREIDVCSEYLLPLLLSQGIFQLGWALAEKGEVAEGIAKMEDGLERIRGTGSEMGMPYFVALLGEAHARQGDIERGQRLIEDAVAKAERTGAHFGYSEMLRMKGELSMGAAPHDFGEAETCFSTAIEIARGQQARLPELRAAVGLANLRKLQGRLDEGRTLVKSLYGWFSEGHDTADLRNAEAILNS